MRHEVRDRGKLTSLSADAVGVVDAALATADDLAPGRMLELAEAKVIEADQEAHRARVGADASRTGVWLSRPRPGDLLAGEEEAATRRVGAKLAPAHALELDAAIDDLADVLATMADYVDLTRDQRPDRALALLRGTDDGEPLPKRRATLVIHLSAAAVAGAAAIARGDQLGPLLLEQVAELLAHRDVDVQPVIDLNAVHAVNGYEHPTKVKRRTLLRTGGDVFPHSSNSGRRLDHDHVTPYDPLGPPGQTGDHNDAPLTRLHHRVKTHAKGWQVDQIGLGAYRWVTPNGLCRVVTPRGTRCAEPIRDASGRAVGEIYSDWVFDLG